MWMDISVVLISSAVEWNFEETEEGVDDGRLVKWGMATRFMVRGSGRSRGGTRRSDKIKNNG